MLIFLWVRAAHKHDAEINNDRWLLRRYGRAAKPSTRVRFIARLFQIMTAWIAEPRLLLKLLICLLNCNFCLHSFCLFDILTYQTFHKVSFIGYNTNRWKVHYNLG